MRVKHAFQTGDEPVEKFNWKHFIQDTVEDIPVNIRLDEDVFKTSSRRLDQEKYIRLTV